MCIYACIYDRHARSIAICYASGRSKACNDWWVWFGCPLSEVGMYGQGQSGVSGMRSREVSATRRYYLYGKSNQGHGICPL